MKVSLVALLSGVATPNSAYYLVVTAASAAPSSTPSPVDDPARDPSATPAPSAFRALARPIATPHATSTSNGRRGPRTYRPRRRPRPPPTRSRPPRAPAIAPQARASKPAEIHGQAAPIRARPPLRRGHSPPRRCGSDARRPHRRRRESPELRALRDAERELFPPATPSLGDSWPTELPSPLSATEDAPHVHASGLPRPPPRALLRSPSADTISPGSRSSRCPTSPSAGTRASFATSSSSRTTRAGARSFAALDAPVRPLPRRRSPHRCDKKGLPEDLLWLAMIESGFDPIGAFRRRRDRASGSSCPTRRARLRPVVDRWADQRLNAEVATEAAADFLGDLHRRFGSWELAIAAYNMGYGGRRRSVRKYNTNDFWALSRLECALPWETTLYVPKILAAAIVGAQPAVFGFDGHRRRRADRRRARARAAGHVALGRRAGRRVTTKELEQLNPELRAVAHAPAQPSSGTTPPAHGRLPSQGARRQRLRRDRASPSSTRISRSPSATSCASASRSSRSPLRTAHAGQAQRAERHRPGRGRPRRYGAPRAGVARGVERQPTRPRWRPPAPRRTTGKPSPSSPRTSSSTPIAGASFIACSSATRCARSPTPSTSRSMKSAAGTISIRPLASRRA